MGDLACAQLRAGARVGVGLIGERMHGGVPAGTVGIEQREQRRVVAGLSGAEGELERAAAGIGQGVDLGGPPASGAGQGMIGGLSGQILVTRLGPVC